MTRPNFSQKWLSFFSLSIILGVVFAVYLPTLNAEFVNWDDNYHLTDNLLVQSLQGDNLKKIFTSLTNKTYIPLTIFSFAIEYHFFGYNPFVYHLTNLILHLLIIIMLYILSIRYLGLGVLGASITALIFGIHPMHVESVAWVTERKDVLYVFFYVAALLSYCHYLQLMTNGPNRLKAGRFIVLTTILGVLSMLAKPMALSLPLVLFIFDWFLKRTRHIKNLIEKIPLFIIIAALTWVTYVVHARSPQSGLLEAIFIWVWTFIFYLRQFIFPVYLVPIYTLPYPISLANFEYLFSILAFLIIIFALYRLRRYRFFLFAFMFYFFSMFFLFRYDSAKDINVVADRFMYLPSFGFCVLLGLVGEKVFLLFQNKLLKGAAGIFWVVILTLSFQKTLDLCRVWQNSISLWQHHLKYFPYQPIALNNLANILREKDSYKEAEKKYARILKILTIEGHPQELLDNEATRSIRQQVESVMYYYEKAIISNPQYFDGHYNLGIILENLGLYNQAFEFLRKATQLEPTHTYAHFHLANTYVRLGLRDKAIKTYDKVLSIDPQDEIIYINVINAYNEAIKFGQKDNLFYKEARSKVIEKFIKLISYKPDPSDSYVNLGSIYEQVEDYPKAAQAQEKAIEINPKNAKAYYNLANIYHNYGNDIEKAKELYNKAIELDSRFVGAYLNLGVLYSDLREYSKAQDYYKKVIELDPNNVNAYFNQGYIFEVRGDRIKAIEFYKKAASLDPENAEAYYNLGNVYAFVQNGEMAVDAYKKAVVLNPEHMNAYVNLSILSYQMGRFIEALRYCQEAQVLGYQPPKDYLQVLESYQNP